MFFSIPPDPAVVLRPAMPPVHDADARALCMTIVTAPFAVAFFSFG
jgi:hypothetical protein